MSARLRDIGRDEGGFVLVLVLFVMAALAVTVSGALMLTQSDHATSRASVNANRAFNAAQAGLVMFIDDRNAVVAGTGNYVIAGVPVNVRARRVAVAGLEEVHEILSRASVRSAGNRMEVREVRQLATLELRPIQPVASFVTSARNVTVVGSFSGLDASASGACNPAARGSVGGIEAVGGGMVDLRNASLAGNPRTQLNADTAAARARMSAEWEELIDPSMEFDYEVPAQAWPNFAMVPLTTYPTIRVRGPFTANATRSGRGLLVVDGALNLSADFQWDGMIVAGDLAYPMSTNAQIRGALLSGLSLTANPSVNIGYTSSGYLRVNYDACKVLQAQQGMLRMQLLPDTWSDPLS